MLRIIDGRWQHGWNAYFCAKKCIPKCCRHFVSVGKWNVERHEWILICVMVFRNDSERIAWPKFDDTLKMPCVSISGNSFRLWFYQGNLAQKSRYGLPYGQHVDSFSECRCPFNHHGHSQTMHHHSNGHSLNEFYIKASDDSVLILINIRIHKNCVVECRFGLWSWSLIDRFSFLPIPITVMRITERKKNAKHTKNQREK